MRINTELSGEDTKVFVHNFQPEIAVIDKKADLIVLRHKNMLRDGTLSLNIFLDRGDLKALYSQLKEMLEPKDTNHEAVDTCLTT